MNARTQLAYLAAGLTLALGLLSFINPLVMVRLLGLEVVEPRGLSEIRATYGALFLAMGAVMLWAVPTGRRGSWLRLPGLLWLAAAVGRALSMAIDGVLTPLNVVILLLELLIGVSALVGSFAAAKPSSAVAIPEANIEEEPPNPLRAYRG